MSYLETLDRELASAGIPSRRGARILAEFADHLEADPQAELGDPSQLAHQFADELGTTLARRAAFTAFAGLAVAGILIVVAFVTAQSQLFASASRASSALGNLGAWMAVVGGQVAFVAGGLAALRAFRTRRDETISGAQARTLIRRAGVGLGAGLVTMVGFGLTALAAVHHTASWWTTLALGLCAAGIVVLSAAAPAVLAAAQLRPVAAGSAGNLSEDLGPVMPSQLRDRPWRFALVVAGLVAVLVTIAGLAAADPFDGALRGLADGLACLAGFGLLGRYLALR